MAQTVLFKKVPLLSDLPRQELDYLASTLQIVNLNAGEVLFREGESGESMYVLLEGEVEVVLGIGTTDEQLLARLGPGEVIGEMSLLIPGGARSASVRASAVSRLWMMTRADFEALLQRQPHLANIMAKTLTKRLDASNSAAFRDLQEKNRQLQEAYDELKAAQKQIIEKERLERELQVAAEIQTSILPQELPQHAGYDFGAVMVPARAVGGDFYDVFLLDGDRIGVVIGDVADKGVPSAIFMARTHALIMSEAAHGGTPGEILRRTNRHLIQLAQSDLFVTVLFGVLDCATGKYDFARAGHELPMQLAPNGTVSVLPHASGQPVGMFDDMHLDENSIALPPGGSLILFTDGATDSRNPKGVIFGHDNLQAALSILSDRSGSETCEGLLKALRDFQGAAPQEDDITLVVIHRKGAPKKR
jgi:phosphoserine phosphatase RsbU/P